MAKSRVPGWAMPMRGTGFWSGLLRVVVYSAGAVALVGWFGWWGVLALPLLVPLVWLVEAIALGLSRVLGQRATTP
jgi:hypothetical protein